MLFAMKQHVEIQRNIFCSVCSFRLMIENLSIADKKIEKCLITCCKLSALLNKIVFYCFVVSIQISHNPILTKLSAKKFPILKF